MALKKLQVQPGFDKQNTASGAEGKWIDGDFVRFRYGLPEKIGGWSQLARETLPGVARAQLAFTNLTGDRYTAIGTSQGLFISWGDKYYDISPTATALTSATFDSTTSSATVTVNKTSHGLSVGRYVTFSSVSLPGGGATGYTVANFEEKGFEILTKTTNTFTITMPSDESGTGMSAGGSASILPYEIVGPTIQTLGYGFGASTWSASTWGTARTASSVTLDPGNWSLDNFGEVLVATIHDGKTFTWDGGASGPTAIRASSSTSGALTTNNPTASVSTLVSDRDRHLFHLGTETTIGTASTQDKMFVRFSNQEDLNTYPPTATNTAGTFRLDTGNEIRAAINAKDYSLILTDSAAYLVQFVGPPFTFSVKQVGTSCGCISQHAAVFANGAVFWMGDAGGFFMFDGTVKVLPCLVEDFVFNTDGDNLGLNFGSTKTIYAGHNSLYNEVTWFYPKDGSDQIDRSVTINYTEGAWTTSSLARTTYQDAYVFDKPYATEYDATATPDFAPISGITNTYGATTNYSHETGTDQIKAGATTAIAANILSGDMDIDDGEVFSAVRRFVPDYKYITGNSKVTLYINNYPNTAAVASSLGPFTVSGSTAKVDTRARGRFIAVKIENDAAGETWRYGTLRVDAQPDGRR